MWNLSFVNIFVSIDHENNRFIKKWIEVILQNLILGGKSADWLSERKKHFHIWTKFASAYLYVTAVEKLSGTINHVFFLEFADSSGCSKDKLAYSDTRSTFSVCGISSDADQRNFTDDDVSFHLTTDASTTAAGFLISYKLIDKPVSSK